jgi:dienelactone hydrolase
MHRAGADDGAARALVTDSGAAGEVVMPPRRAPVRGTPEPGASVGVVVIVHGSGVTRSDERIRRVAQHLRRAGMCTAVVDLLDAAESGERHNVFDAELQARRLLEVTRWLALQPETAGLPVGYFATGVGAAAAFMAAAREPTRAATIVVHDGQPDPSLYWLPKVTAPTLFIVDPRDLRARQRAEAAWGRLAGKKRIALVETTHPPGADARDVEAVARHAARWFLRHLVPAPAAAGARA